MQRILTLIIIVVYSFLGSCSQEQEFPSKIDFGETISFKDVKITFSEVLSDSRCPKKVQCIQAGEANIALLIKEKGIPSYTREITISASSELDVKSIPLLERDSIFLRIKTLWPYPETPDKIDNESYSLELQHH